MNEAFDELMIRLMVGHPQKYNSRILRKSWKGALLFFLHLAAGVERLELESPVPEPHN